MVPSVVYLGHRIDREGLHPLAEKVKAIKEAPRPRNASELKSYLGLLTYYSKFMPNLSSTLAPLYSLLRSSSHWHWGVRQAKAFKASQQLLTFSEVLVHFDPRNEIVLSCDASPYGGRCCPTDFRMAQSGLLGSLLVPFLVQKRNTPR